MNTLFAQGATLLATAALVADLRHDLRRLVQGRSIVLIGIFSWYLLESLTLSPAIYAYPQATYDYGILAVAAAIVAFLVGYHATAGCPWFLPMAAKVSALDDPRMLWRVVALSAIVGFAPILFYSDFQLGDLLHGILGMRQTWAGLIARGRYGGLREALLQTENLVTGAGAFAVILLLARRSTLPQRVVCGVVTVWPILRGFGSGTRNALVLASLPILAVLYLRCRPALQRRLLLLGLFVTPLAYMLMAAIVASRDSGRFSWEARQRASYVGNEMFQELLYISTHVPQRIPYQMGQSYLFQLCAPVPRFLWPGKPRMEVGVQMATWRGEIDRRTGMPYYTRSPGILGEMYLNFGFPGIVLLNALGGWLVRGWDRIRTVYDHSLPTMVFYLAGLGVLFFLGRSFTAQLLYPLAFFVLAVGMISAAGRFLRTVVQGGRP
jgi:oligosaccharide repeat unit polymerase